MSASASQRSNDSELAVMDRLMPSSAALFAIGGPISTHGSKVVSLGLRAKERDAMCIPKIHLCGGPSFLTEMALLHEMSWCRAPLKKADFVFAFISDPVCPHMMAGIWTAIASGIPVYLFFDPGIDRELFWHCRRLAANWMGFSTVHPTRLRETLQQIIADWQSGR